MCAHQPLLHLVLRRGRSSPQDGSKLLSPGVSTLITIICSNTSHSLQSFNSILNLSLPHRHSLPSSCHHLASNKQKINAVSCLSTSIPVYPHTKQNHTTVLLKKTSLPQAANLLISVNITVYKQERLLTFL